jgi:aryl-alcohol dehydrogenase-like predicted oxidoreductase
MALQHPELGDTGLKVSPIAYGTWQFSGQWGTVDEKEAIGAVQRARELGINLFDTAQGYGFGAAERLLARALDGDLATRRSSIVLATKGGLRVEGDLTLRDSSPEWLRRGIESSLDALGVDYIDLYQIHWPDFETPMAVSAEVLADYVAQGVIRHVGVSNYSVDQMRAFAEVLPVETLQSPYHLFRRGIEAEVLPYVAAHGIGVLAYGPLAHGLLGGRMSEDTKFPADDWRAHSSVFNGQAFRKNLRVVDALTAVAQQYDATIAQLAVAWVLARREIDVAIVGSMRARHIEETAQGAGLTLTEQDLAGIDAIMAGAVEVPGANPEGFG